MEERFDVVVNEVSDNAVSVVSEGGLSRNKGILIGTAIGIGLSWAGASIYKKVKRWRAEKKAAAEVVEQVEEAGK